MVATLKFSQFLAAGNLASGSNVVGLYNPGTGTTNASFINTSSGSNLLQWATVTTSSLSMVTNFGYFTNNAARVVLTLPLVSSVGDQISIAGISASGWRIAQLALQSVIIGQTTSTVGVGGSVSSANSHDSLNLVCCVANLQWIVVGGPQSAGLVII